MIRFFGKYWISILLCLVIVYLCLVRMSDLPKVEINNFDKFVHVFMTMGLSGIIFFEQTSYLKKMQAGGKIFFNTLLFPVLFMGGIELAQEYLPVSRTGDWMDFWADSIGALIGYFICIAINKYYLSKKKI